MNLTLRDVLYILFFIALIAVCGAVATAQVVIGSSTQEANAGAILDLSKSAMV
ncbi:MAG: hypothetical protein LBN93_10060 [Candidatus Symbiothrix sp.]|jgi:hypothetical protein|nr:hypothetical protein [Candidatus Symbiothrix sp.]